jgi:hypothetical protein
VAGITPVDANKLICSYLGTQQGYLNGFSNITELERFYPLCGVDVNPRTFTGTNRAKFEAILLQAPPADQARIIRGALEKCPPNPDAWSTRTQGLHDRLLDVAKRLEASCPVESLSPAITSAVVERAIADAERLLNTEGATSAVDRLHTALHGYLRAVCDSAGIVYTQSLMMSGLFGLLRNQHPAFADLGPRPQEILQILRSMSGIMDAMNPIRNEASVAHPNKELIERPEAALVVNAARTILHYLDMKLSAVTV